MNLVSFALSLEINLKYFSAYLKGRSVCEKKSSRILRNLSKFIDLRKFLPQNLSSLNVCSSIKKFLRIGWWCHVTWSPTSHHWTYGGFRSDIVVSGTPQHHDLESRSPPLVQQDKQEGIQSWIRVMQQFKVFDQNNTNSTLAITPIIFNV